MVFIYHLIHFLFCVFCFRNCAVANVGSDQLSIARLPDSVFSAILNFSFFYNFYLYFVFAVAWQMRRSHVGASPPGFRLVNSLLGLPRTFSGRWGQISKRTNEFYRWPGGFLVHF